MPIQIGGYERVVKHRGNGLEAVFFRWPHGTRTPKHNHRSHGTVWVLEGEVFEVRNGAKIRYTKGDSFPEIPFSTVHIVGNDSDLVAVTFHIYLPELAMETFADDESDYTAIGAFHDGFPSRRRI